MATTSMTAHDFESHTSTSWWGAMLLGAVLLLCGLFLLGNVVVTTVISAVLLGVVLLIAGASEIVQAFAAPHWRGFFLRLAVGCLYAIAGVMLIADPVRASIALTLIFALSLIASGIVRLFLSAAYWQWAGELLLISGLFGILAGFVILAKWPVSGLWVLGFFVAIDLLLHGAWWLALGWRLRERHEGHAA
jgi:uncharacterized membrane protein HdeD (DUF308 family)